MRELLSEDISPELVLVDPELRARAQPQPLPLPFPVAQDLEATSDDARSRRRGRTSTRVLAGTIVLALALVSGLVAASWIKQPHRHQRGASSTTGPRHRASQVDPTASRNPRPRSRVPTETLRRPARHGSPRLRRHTPPTTTTRLTTKAPTASRPVLRPHKRRVDRPHRRATTPTVHATVTLSWKSSPGADYYVLRLFRGGRMRFTTWTLTPSVPLSAARAPLEPGVYRWRAYAGQGARVAGRLTPIAAGVVRLR